MYLLTSVNILHVSCYVVSSSHMAGSIVNADYNTLNWWLILQLIIQQIDNKTNNFIRPGKKLFYLQFSLLRRTKLRISQDICYLEFQILRESWPYLDNVTICWIISCGIL